MSADFVFMCEPDAILVAYFDGKGNPVPGKLSLVFVERVGRRNSGGAVARRSCCHLFFPGTGLPLDQVYSHLDFLRLPGIDHPYHLAAGFLFADLHPDYVSRLQLVSRPESLAP